MGENNEALQRAATDWDYLLNESGTTVCGSPETVIRQIEKFVDLGVDEVIFHLDSVPHEMIMEAMELLGRFVIPHFRDRNNVVRPTDEILDTIRAMRPKATGAMATAAE
jgi:alkanesulfonate monooxygenase SsuD/methylene tetrahydromethanopterin reductase-like flavin-dependent oxidoreductase (luciferase family)